MFLFPDPKTIDIAGVKIGGQPGENPPVLAGTIFYERHKILTGAGFDKNAALGLINKQLEMSDETKIPSMINVFGDSVKTFRERIDFVADNCRLPIMIDSPDYGVRIAALKHVDEAGLSKRVIYNSINLSVNREEIEALKKSDVDSAIILAYNPVDSSLEGKLRFLEKEGAFGKGMLDIAKEAGIKNILVDTAMTPLYHGAGIALKGIIACKSKFGYPTGCATHNAAVSWQWLSGRPTKSLVDVSSNIIPIVLGADFVLFGPIEYADRVFDIAAFAEIAIEEAMDGMTNIRKIEL
ncbi:MAG: tetrahydromethanopterin S-methyltransferase subunit H [archaeon]